ncbi:MAG: sensor histidine kinase [Bacteroidetes bacterium]|nr:sensor histidine kinase [Bacteroidota bacterium]
MQRIAQLLVLWFAPLVLLADAPADSGSFVYHGEAATPTLGRHLLMLEDPTGTMTLDEAVRATGFRASPVDIPSPGLSASAFWARFELVNDSPLPSLVLRIAHAEIDEVDLYMVQDGRAVPIAHAGLLRPLDRQAQTTPELGFVLPVGERAHCTVFLRVRSNKQLRIPLLLETPTAFVQGQSTRNMLIGAYIGIMLVMAVYNLFVFFSMRNRSYLIYFFYILLVCATQLAFTGVASFHIWPGNTWLSSHSTLLLTALTAITANEFMAAFIHTRDFLPRLARVAYLFYVLLGLGVLLDVLGLSLQGYRMIQGAAGGFAFFQLFVAYRISRRGFRPARYFLVAWCFFLTAVMVFVLKDWDLLPYNELTRYSMSFGSVVEVVLLSFGLADKINVLRKEKERSQAQALVMSQENERIIRDQNVMLEQKVVERTHALQESNDHLKRTQSQLVSAEKMASLGQLTAGIAHEINNPLNFISSNIPPLKRDLLELKEVLDAYRQASGDATGLQSAMELERRIGVDDTVREVEDILGCMEEGAARTSEIVRGLRTFSRLDEDDLKPADINEGLRSTVVVLGPQFRDLVTVTFDLADLPRVECYPGKLNQVFMNMLNNASHAAKARHGKQGGKVDILTRLEGDDAVRITIRDNGTGMDKATRTRIFEPFFTTKDVGEGTGLGLSIAQSIIEKHSGRIDVHSTPGEGTSFTITIPITQAAQAAKRA